MSTISKSTLDLYVWEIVFEKPRAFRKTRQANGLAKSYKEAETAVYAAYTAYLEKHEAGSSAEVGKLSLIPDKN